MSRILGIVLFLMVPPALAQQPSKSDTERKHIPISIEDVLRQHTTGAVSNPKSGAQDLNDRIRSFSAISYYSQDYLLGPGDVVELTVFGIEDLKKKELTLDSQGRIFLPFINEIQLLGLTARESEVKIATLFEASVMKHPQVSLGISQYKSQFINVLGSVLKPGPYQLTRRAFVVDALAMAGGLNERAGNKVFVHRLGVAPELAGLVNSGTDAKTPADLISEPVSLAEERKIIEIDLVQLLEKGDISLNIPIYAGNVIAVPERTEQYFYVLGDVFRGGAFEIKRGEKMTLSKALASAGGILGTAKGSKSAIMRQSPDGASTSQIPVDVDAVLKGKAEDMVLAQNDVVFVPGSTTKTVSKTVLGSIGGLLTTLLYIGVR